MKLTMGAHMKLATALVAMASSAALALPLHPGGSWVYAVVDRGRTSIALKSLRVLDSTAVSGGTNWRLVLRDSVSGATDSLAILAKGDGSQTWTRSSPNLPWGPTPWGVSPRVWWDGWWDVSLARGTWEQPVMGKGDRVFSCPPLAWDDAAGLVWAQDPMSGAEWTMLARDGVARTGTPWTLVLPEVGARWTWRRDHWKAPWWTGGAVGAVALSGLDPAAVQALTGNVASTTSTVSWEVVERQKDSVGWKRLMIRQTISSGGDSVYPLRLHPATRRRQAAPELLDLDEHWWRLPGEQPVAGFVPRHHYSETPVLAGPSLGMGIACVRNGSRGNLSGGLDSAVEIGGTRVGNAQISSSSWYRTETVLLQDGERLVRSSPVAVGDPATRPRGLRALEALADRYPGTQVRWRDLRGRGGSFPASSLEAVLDRRNLGLLFLEAHFPDGTRWSGRVF